MDTYVDNPDENTKYEKKTQKINWKDISSDYKKKLLIKYFDNINENIDNEFVISKNNYIHRNIKLNMKNINHEKIITDSEKILYFEGATINNDGTLLLPNDLYKNNKKKRI